MDPVNKPSHYTSGKVECIDAIESSMTKEAFKGFCRGSAMKYVFRAGKKDNEEQDVRKAIWYLNKMIEKK